MSKSIVDQIIDFESGSMPLDEVPMFVQLLIDGNYINHLQGAYQRLAQELIKAKLCTPKES